MSGPAQTMRISWKLDQNCDLYRNFQSLLLSLDHCSNDSSNDSGYRKLYDNTCDFFFSFTDARCRAPFLRKNRPSKTTTMTQRSAQSSPAPKSGEPKTMTNADSRPFAFVAAIAGTSQAHVGSSRIVGILRNFVSLGPWECAVTMVPGKCECSY